MDLDELKNRLDQMNGPALRAAEREALTQIGDLYLTAIRERAPVKAEDEKGGDLEPGALRDGFRAHVHVPTDAGAAHSEIPRVIVAPIAAVHYVARFVEDGHVSKGCRASASGHVPAHPFVRPAADTTEAPAIDKYAETMTAAMQKALNG